MRGSNVLKRHACRWSMGRCWSVVIEVRPYMKGDEVAILASATHVQAEMRCKRLKKRFCRRRIAKERTHLPSMYLDTQCLGRGQRPGLAFDMCAWQVLTAITKLPTPTDVCAEVRLALHRDRVREDASRGSDRLHSAQTARAVALSLSCRYCCRICRRSAHPDVHFAALRASSDLNAPGLGRPRCSHPHR
jgi:hypothetical protein